MLRQAKISLLLPWLVLATLIPTIAFSQSAITLLGVQGEYDYGYLESGHQLRFYFGLEYQNASGLLIEFFNGFRLYSDDGCQWDTLVGAFDSDLSWYFQPNRLYVEPHGNDGSGADTIGFVGLAGEIPMFIVLNAWNITTRVAPEFEGTTLCLDSCWFPPDGDWHWTTEYGVFVPTWAGPYCYEIGHRPCCDYRGDVDHSGVLPIDISDLVYLVDYMFSGGPEPYCFGEGDIDGSGTQPIDISDLVYLVDYMFTSGPLPPPCQ